jgi:hypothetical protein
MDRRMQHTAAGFTFLVRHVPGRGWYADLYRDGGYIRTPTGYFPTEGRAKAVARSWIRHMLATEQVVWSRPPSFELEAVK